MPMPEAPVLITNDTEKSGKPRTGAWHRASFSLEKVVAASDVH